MENLDPINSTIYRRSLDRAWCCKYLVQWFVWWTWWNTIKNVPAELRVNKWKVKGKQIYEEGIWREAVLGWPRVVLMLMRISKSMSRSWVILWNVYWSCAFKRNLVAKISGICCTIWSRTDKSTKWRRTDLTGVVPYVEVAFRIREKSEDGSWKVKDVDGWSSVASIRTTLN